MKRSALAVAVAVVVGAGLTWAGCTQTANPGVVRSLERSGKSAFLCIANPGLTSPGQQLDACFTPPELPTLRNYRTPHVVALVTQTSRGEVAVVDVTSQTVVDADPSVPGFNFLPVGALPTDIVSTTGSNASFVAVADPHRPGIFAIPSAWLPLPAAKQRLTLSSWPSCSFPPGAVPGAMAIVPDQTSSTSDPGSRRAHCDGSPGQAAAPDTDLSGEIALFGRPKLVVSIPNRGELVVIDAQDVLSLPPGTFEPCPIERRVALRVDTTLTPPVTGADASVVDASADVGSPDEGGAGPDATSGDVEAGVDGGDDAGGGDAGPDGPKCSGRFFPSAPASLQPHPTALAYADDGRLFVSDDSASVIHVLDMSDPCTPTQRLPLLPFSAVDPSRAVVSGAIAVSPLTSDKKRFVYATDLKNNGSVMVFDVTPGSTERTPLYRRDQLTNPYEPPDRIGMAAPVEDLTFVTHEIPLADADPNTGTRPRGIPCDPTNAADPNRPPADFVTSGAGPRRLRGTFAFLALSNGQISIVDVDDLDVACRRPRFTDATAVGCSGQMVTESTFPAASQEHSCNVVERHRPRSFQFFSNASGAGRRAPAMLSFPLLYDRDGTVLNLEDSTGLPRLLGPRFEPEKQDPAAQRLLASASGSTAEPGLGLEWNPDLATVNWVAFDLREPRNHVEQTWSVTYEGIIPWFVGRKGRLQCAADRSAIECEQGNDPSHFNLFDSSVGFCDGGAQGADLAASQGIPSGDIFEIIDDLPHPDDPYWATVAPICSRQACESNFGTPQNPVFVDRTPGSGEPIGGRDIMIEKAYQDHLVLRRSASGGVPVACCFPYPVTYTIRAGQHWTVSGSTTGFAHHEIPDPTAPDPSTAACIVSCDPAVALRNGRVVGRPWDTSAERPPIPPEELPTYDDDPRTFRNAQLRFVLWEPSTCPPGQTCRVRDRFFSFAQVGAFTPMTIPLSSNPVLPQSIRYVRGIQKLAITDPITQGLMLFDLNRLSANVFFY